MTISALQRGQIVRTLQNRSSQRFPMSFERWETTRFDCTAVDDVVKIVDRYGEALNDFA